MGKYKLRTGRVILVILILIAVGLVFKTYSGGYFISKFKVAATVNGEEISVAELDKQYGSIPDEYKLFITKDDLLEQLVTQKLLKQEAKRQNIDVSEIEVTDSITKAIEQAALSKEEFESKLGEQGMTLSDLRGYYREQLLISKLINQEVLAR